LQALNRDIYIVVDIPGTSVKSCYMYVAKWCTPFSLAVSL